MKVNRKPEDTFEPLLLTRTEVADMLRVSPATVDRLGRSCKLPIVRIDRRPRFRLEDVRALVARGLWAPNP